MAGATQDDIRRILLSLRELRDRVEALEVAVAALGYVPPAEPEAPALPADVRELLERGDRRGAVRARGISRHLADQALKALGR